MISVEGRRRRRTDDASCGAAITPRVTLTLVGLRKEGRREEGRGRQRERRRRRHFVRFCNNPFTASEL